MLPTFIVIGAMKCGTTSLYHYLDLHPEISMSSEKEPEFFIKNCNYKKGIDWYESLFKNAKTSAKAYGECSTAYTKLQWYPETPQLMHSVLPDIKLIYLLRDPVERIISHYIQDYAERRKEGAIYDHLKNLKKNKYILISSYYFQLQHYLHYYSKKKILVVCSEDLKLDPFSVLREIFHFLEVDTSFADNAFLEKFHLSSVKKSRSILDQRISNKFLKSLIKPFLPDSLKQEATIQRPKLDRVTRGKLIECLRPDIEQLKQFTGKTFDAWCL